MKPLRATAGSAGFAAIPLCRELGFTRFQLVVFQWIIRFRVLICWRGTSRTCLLEQRSHGFGTADVQCQNWFFPGKENECDIITGTDREGACWFLGLILKLLVVGRVEIDLDIPSKQDKLDQILACMRNQESENKAIRKLLETHSLEMINVKKEAKDVKEK